MPKPENTFIGRIHRKLKIASPETYFMKNSNPYAGGIPDCYYERNCELWVEYKYTLKIGKLNLAKPKAKPCLSDLQSAWLQRRFDNGLPTLVIVGVGRNGGIVFDNTTDWLREYSKGEIERYIHSDDEIVQILINRTE